MTALATLGLAVGTIGSLLVIILQLRRSESERHAIAIPRVQLTFPPADDPQRVVLYPVLRNPASRALGNPAPYDIAVRFIGRRYVHDVAVTIECRGDVLLPTPEDGQRLLATLGGGADIVEPGETVSALFLRSTRLDQFLAGTMPDLATVNLDTTSEFWLEATVRVAFSTDDGRRYQWSRTVHLDGPTRVVDSGPSTLRRIDPV